MKFIVSQEPLKPSYQKGQGKIKTQKLKTTTEAHKNIPSSCLRFRVESRQLDCSKPRAKETLNDTTTTNNNNNNNNSNSNKNRNSNAQKYVLLDNNNLIVII